MIRDRVFKELANHDFSVQATVLEKSKAYPRVRTTDHLFYQYGWFYHFKNTAPKVIKDGVSELHVTAASIGTKNRQTAFSTAVNNVVQQVLRSGEKKHRTNFCPAMADPCLQAADYCTWAIQRRWEGRDVRSYDLIKERINHEFDLWAHGDKHQY